MTSSKPTSPSSSFEKPSVASSLSEKSSSPQSASRQRQVESLFETSAEVKRAVVAEGCCEVLTEMALMVADKMEKGGKVMFCGNGGSAADAQHLAAEFLVRLRSSVDRKGLPSLALSMDSSTMTACANDYDYDVLYARMVETLGQEHDVLIGITTSGRSSSVVKALQKAQALGILSFGFLGGEGKPALDHCDRAFVVPSSQTPHIQESHITAGHALIEVVEDELIARGCLKPL